MNMQPSLHTIAALAIVAVGTVPTPSLAQVPLTISYQGFLTHDGEAVTGGEHVLTFRLYDRETGGTSAWMESHGNVAISEGVFDVLLGSVESLSQLSFASAMWISVAVGGPDATELSPRLPLGASPYAFHARSIGENAIVAGENVSITRAGHAMVISASVPGGVGGEDASVWRLTGNAGIDPEAHFVGTLDDQPVVFRAGGQVALRLQPPATPETAPNVIAGFGGNHVDEFATGATISGGGHEVNDTEQGANIVLDSFGTVGGGRSNTAGNDSFDALYATVAGGRRNIAGASFSTVGGGFLNAALSNNSTVAGGSLNQARFAAFVGGGSLNRAEGIASAIGGGTENLATNVRATIGGGGQNQATGPNAVVPGGYQNTAAGSASLAAGSGATAEHDGTFVWASATDGTPFASTGDNQFLVLATGGVGVNTNAMKPNVIATMSRELQSAEYQLELRNEGLITNGNFGGISFTQSGDGSTALASLQVLYHNNGLPDLALNLRTPFTATVGPRMLFLNDGRVRFPYGPTRVGIGVDNPVEKLEVAGNVKANNVAVSSDARLKRDVSPIPDAMSLVEALRGVHYLWRTDEYPERGFDEGLQYGFIAQELQRVAPDLVREGADGMLAVGYIQLIPILVEAIKQQQIQIATLTDHVSSLIGAAAVSSAR